MIVSLASSGRDPSHLPVERSSDSVPSGSSPAVPEWQLGPNVPQSRGRLLRWVGATALRLTGWQLAGTMPDLARFVIVVAPHTSNWDFVVALFAKWALGLQVRFIGKDSLFRPPLGWFMRALGGVPVVRSRANNLVEQSIHEFATREQFVLVLAPEGTRRRVDEWKAGFWHIANAAGVPVCCVALDYRRRIIRLGPITYCDDATAADGVARIRSYFEGVQGRNPQYQ